MGEMKKFSSRGRISSSEYSIIQDLNLFIVLFKVLSGDTALALILALEEVTLFTQDINVQNKQT